MDEKDVFRKPVFCKCVKDPHSSDFIKTNLKSLLVKNEYYPYL